MSVNLKNTFPIKPKTLYNVHCLIPLLRSGGQFEMFGYNVSAHPIGPWGFFAAKAAPTNVPVFCRSGFNRDQPTNGQIGKSSYVITKKINRIVIIKQQLTNPAEYHPPGVISSIRQL